jgi:UDPglucose 6-dehydrogenase
MSKTVGCVGAGWVGKATINLFGWDKVVLYDPFIGYENPLHSITANTSKEDINRCPITFIAVPTNGLESGLLDTSIVEEVVAWCESPLIVIRSTVNPGTTDYLAKKYNKRIVFQAEYLGESPNHVFLDMKTRPFVVMGGNDEDMQEVISLYTSVYNSNITITQLTAKEAEITKLSENRAIGFKVMQMHELYLACKASGTNFYKIRDAVYGADPRFDLWFSFVYKDDDGKEKMGYHSSKCLKKDISAWESWAMLNGYLTELTGVMDSMSKDWYGKSAAELIAASKETAKQIAKSIGREDIYKVVYDPTEPHPEGTFFGSVKSGSAIDNTNGEYKWYTPE